MLQIAVAIVVSDAAITIAIAGRSADDACGFEVATIGVQTIPYTSTLGLPLANRRARPELGCKSAQHSLNKRGWPADWRSVTYRTSQLVDPWNESTSDAGPASLPERIELRTGDARELPFADSTLESSWRSAYCLTRPMPSVRSRNWSE